MKVNKHLTSFFKFLAISGLFIGGFYLLMTYQSQGEKRYGYKLETPMMSYWPGVEVLMVGFVDKDGIFDKAGFKGGDIIVDREFPNARNLVQYLNQESGIELWLDVILYEDFEVELYLAKKCKTRRVYFRSP